MKEEQKKGIWDVALATAGPVLAVIGLLIGVWQFNRGEENKTKLENQLITERDRVEFQRKLWLERLSTYKAIAEQVGKIATTDKADKSFAPYVEQFDAAYWGEMIFVEDSAVEKAMIAFRVEITDYQLGRSDPAHVKGRADALIKVLQDSIKTGTPP